MAIVWNHVMKFVPDNGLEETLALSSVFTDTSGPVRTEVAHKPDQTKRADTNRREGPTTWGFRPECELLIPIFTADLAKWVALIRDRLASKEWTCYLSLDGGVNYREVSLAGFTGPKTIEGKTFAGVEYTITMRGRDLVEQPPALGDGTW
jgi:hypothetical protein